MSIPILVGHLKVVVIDYNGQQETTKFSSYSPVKSSVQEALLSRSYSLHGSTMNLDILRDENESFNSNISINEIIRISVLPKDSEHSNKRTNSKLSTLRESRNGKNGYLSYNKLT